MGTIKKQHAKKWVFYGNLGHAAAFFLKKKNSLLSSGNIWGAATRKTRMTEIGITNLEKKEGRKEKEEDWQDKRELLFSPTFQIDTTIPFPGTVFLKKIKSRIFRGVGKSFLIGHDSSSKEEQHG